MPRQKRVLTVEEKVDQIAKLVASLASDATILRDMMVWVKNGGGAAKPVSMNVPDPKATRKESRKKGPDKVLDLKNLPDMGSGFSGKKEA